MSTSVCVVKSKIPMSSKLIVRPAEPADIEVIFHLIQALADYEKLSQSVTGSVNALKEHLFGSTPYVEAILAEYAGEAVGFALFFQNYSTFLTQPGIYLEDLFVLPNYRRQGIGKAMLAALAQLAVTRGFGRLEWTVLDWNEPAIAFYRRMGALVHEDRRICRMTGDSLNNLASGVSKTMLRPAVPADMLVIFSLLQRKAKFDKQVHTFSGNADALKKHLFGSRTYAEAVLAESSGQVVGFATFLHNYSTFLTKPGIYLDDLFVIPEYQWEGIGAILTHLGKIAVERNCGRLEWTIAAKDKQAIVFYECLGASVLPDWRICCAEGDSLTQLAAKVP